MTMQGRPCITLHPTSLQQYMLSSLTSDSSSTSRMNAFMSGSLLPVLPPLLPLLRLLVAVVLPCVEPAARSMLNIFTATCRAKQHQDVSLDVQW
jgi:hypothetical protein